MTDSEQAVFVRASKGQETIFPYRVIRVIKRQCEWVVRRCLAPTPRPTTVRPCRPHPRQWRRSRQTSASGCRFLTPATVPRSVHGSCWCRWGPPRPAASVALIGVEHEARNLRQLAPEPGLSGEGSTPTINHVLELIAYSGPLSLGSGPLPARHRLPHRRWRRPRQTSASCRRFLTPAAVS